MVSKSWLNTCSMHLHLFDCAQCCKSPLTLICGCCYCLCVAVPRGLAKAAAIRVPNPEVRSGYGAVVLVVHKIMPRNYNTTEITTRHFMFFLLRPRLDFSALLKPLGKQTFPLGPWNRSLPRPWNRHRSVTFLYFRCQLYPTSMKPRIDIYTLYCWGRPHQLQRLKLDEGDF